jgi:hypothetical protein
MKMPQRTVAASSTTGVIMPQWQACESRPCWINESVQSFLRKLSARIKRYPCAVPVSP